jgi:hypothetical protein
VATLAREVVVSAAVLLLASLGAARIDVLWVGKAGTFALMCSYPAFLLSYGKHGPEAEWQVPVHWLAWVAGIIGLTLAWIAAGSYIPVARRALVDGRRARKQQRTPDGPMPSVASATTDVGRAESVTTAGSATRPGNAASEVGAVANKTTSATGTAPATNDGDGTDPTTKRREAS